MKRAPRALLATPNIRVEAAPIAGGAPIPLGCDLVAVSGGIHLLSRYYGVSRRGAVVLWSAVAAASSSARRSEMK